MVSFTSYPSAEEIADALREDEAETFADLLEHVTREFGQERCRYRDEFKEQMVKGRVFSDTERANLKAFAEILLEATKL